MKKRPFRGKYSGFLMIGEEKAEYRDKKLVSYYAKPYCENADTVPDSCIEFKDNTLIIRDVESPDGDMYSCIWEQDDIESALDRLCEEADYMIQEISCRSIEELFIPSACKGIRSNAFAGSLSFYKIIYNSKIPHFVDAAPGNIYMCSAKSFMEGIGHKEKAKSHSVNGVRELMKYLPVERTVPDYNGNTFVLLGSFSQYYDNALHNMIPIMGGGVNDHLSDETDYIVIYGLYTPSDAVMQYAISQKEKGRTTKVLFFEDIAESLHIRLRQADKDNFAKLLRYMWEFSEENDDSFVPALNRRKGEKHSASALHALMQQLPFMHSVLEFKGKVFSLIGNYCEDYLLMLHRMIERRGGEIFATMNKRTDIIVAYGCKSVTKPFRDAASDIKTKGRTISVILFEELAAQLGIPLLEEERQNYEELCRELEKIESEADAAPSDSVSAPEAQASVKFKYRKNQPWALKRLKGRRPMTHTFSADKVKGKKFTIAGRMGHELNNYVTDLIVKNGGIFDTTLDSSTDYIIVYGLDKDPDKISKLCYRANGKYLLFEEFAKAMGIELID